MTAGSSSSSRLLAWLQLMRLPNVFTAIADVLMGFWLTHETLSPAGVLLLLLIASSCLYTSGMVLNDVYDLEQDRRERPNRPLPSGRIALRTATRVGWAMMLGGLLAAVVTSWVNADEFVSIPDRFGFAVVGNFGPVAAAIGLAASIVLYDCWLKRLWIGPVIMGLCRMWNVILGLSAGSIHRNDASWTVAVGLGVYVIGVTWFARREARLSNRIKLIGALLTMLAGIALLWYWPRLMLPERLFATLQFEPGSWTLVWILIALVISSRFLHAIADPQPRLVQAAVKTGILSIIVLDAVTVFALRGPGPSIAILFLIVPTMALGAWVYST